MKQTATHEETLNLLSEAMACVHRGQYWLASVKAERAGLGAEYLAKERRRSRVEIIHPEEITIQGGVE